MKILHSWLKEYGNINASAQEIAEILTDLGLEVESVTSTLPPFSGVLVGKIINIKKHPDADKLNLCEVELAPEQKLQIVCGANNVQVGRLVPVATDGANLNGNILKCRKIRNIYSEGMICSTAELGLGDDADGIWLLEDENLKQGQDFRSQLSEDFIYELSIGPNRPDCLGLRGILRELALRLPNTQLLKKELPPQGVQNQELVKVMDTEACPRYAGVLIKNIKIQPSPAWLQTTLTKLGLRTVNNAVDITNYLTYIYGLPMHAFDADCLKDKQIVVRFAQKGEEIETLDGVKRRLEPDDLLICDTEKPVAIAGVMGGLQSEIKPDTKNVFIEIAVFEPISVRQTAKRHKMHTDASHRFERGMDIELPPHLLSTAIAYFTDICGGETVAHCDIYTTTRKSPIIELPENLAPRILGISFTAQQIQEWCQKLSVQVISTSPLRVQAPSFRLDLTRPIDFIEEFARIYGFNNIAAQSPQINLQPTRRNHGEELAEKIRQFLTGHGLFECISYPFVKNAQQNSVRLSNPIADDMGFLRHNLAENLIKIAILNYKKDNCRLGLYELANVFLQQNDSEYIQNYHLGVLFCNFTAESWKNKTKENDIFDLKGLFTGLEQTLKIEGLKLEESQEKPALAEPKEQLSIIFRRQKIGDLYRVRKELLKTEKISSPMFVLEINLEPLLQSNNKTIRFQGLSQIPGTERRLALLTPQQISAEEILAQVKKMRLPNIENIKIFDVYSGEGITTGYKSLGVSLYFRGVEKTLSEEEISHTTQEILQKLQKLNIGLRP